MAPGVIVERSAPMRGATELTVHHPSAALLVQPGQFFQLSVGAPHTLLRRPYSAAWADPGSGRLGFIFNVVGAGSAWLANRHEGHEVDLVGPLGRGFDLDGGGPAIVVAGGLGVAVFPGVVRALLARGRRVTVLLGARTADQLLPPDRFADAEVRTATDDGSGGHHGSVIDLLLEEPLPPPLAGAGPSAHASGASVPGERLRRSDQGGGIDLFACGPTSMLQALMQTARRIGIPLSSVQVALETPMGCGVGTCLGCAAPRRGGGYLLTCQDGPCLRADRIEWHRMRDAFHG